MWQCKIKEKKLQSEKIALLTLSLPSLLVPTPFTKGKGEADPSAISKTVTPMNLKFCRVLQTPLKALEMFNLFTYCSLGYHSNSSKERCFGGKSLDFTRKYQ